MCSLAAMPEFVFEPARYPSKPGCYLMRDASGTILYVGKAKHLRRRLASYFGNRPQDWKTRELVKHVASIEVIIVNNETESLILENNLIKLHKPPYNRMLVPDDTGYFYIALTDEALPRLVPYRKHRINKPMGDSEAERRFGPYLNRRFRDTLLTYVMDTHQLRNCNPLPKRVCLRYHLGTCGGVCEGYVSAEDYADAVKRAIVFLSRSHTDVLRQMEQQLKTCMDVLEFERAQRLKAHIDALRSALQRQIVERDVSYDQDVVYFGEDGVCVTEIRRGAVLGVEFIAMDVSREAFFATRYARESPKELIVNELPDVTGVAEALRASNGCKISVTVPKRGVKVALLRLCEQNYAYRVGAGLDKGA